MKITYIDQETVTYIKQGPSFITNVRICLVFLLLLTFLSSFHHWYLFLEVDSKEYLSHQEVLHLEIDIGSQIWYPSIDFSQLPLAYLSKSKCE